MGRVKDKLLEIAEKNNYVDFDTDGRFLIALFNNEEYAFSFMVDIVVSGLMSNFPAEMRPYLNQYVVYY